VILISSILATSALSIASANEAGFAPTPKVTWTVSSLYISGGALLAHADIEAPKEGASLASWMLEPSGFTVNGVTLGDRKDPHSIKLAPNQKISFDVDLGPIIAESKAFASKDFKLGYGKEYVETKEVEVRFAQAVDKGLDFMAMKPEELVQYHVVLQTNRGNMEVEFYPDVAPNHVRNFLDLAYTGFYTGTQFHRVMAGFMIQGGCPNTKTADTGSWGQGHGPRMLKAEFNKKKHVRGVLSMARGPSPDSGSSQFFVMHADAPNLDGQYSVFGMLVDGFNTLDAIAAAKGPSLGAIGGLQPSEPQKILAAVVIKVAASGKEGK
jgi:peptidyl-prolyl cis-trans isomerase B (cyclophilin B)